MTDLFFDIETVANFDSPEEYFQIKNKIETGQLTENSKEKDLYWKYHLGALNPYDGKVILLTYKIDDGHVFHLKEWEFGEKQLLQKFYNLVADLEYQSTSEEHLKIIGQNIRGFDLIFLFQRMVQFQLENTKWLYNRLIKKPEIIDFIQIHLPLNNLQIKGLNHNVLVNAYGFQPNTIPAPEIAIQYYMKKFKEIVEYADRKFIYPFLYKKIRKDGLVSKELLQDSIKLFSSEKHSNPFEDERKNIEFL